MNIYYFSSTLFYYFSFVLLEFPNLVYKRGDWDTEMALQLRNLSALTEEREGSQHPYITQGFLEPSKVIRMCRHKLKLRESMWTGGGVKSSWAISISTKREAVAISLLFVSKANGRKGWWHSSVGRELMSHTQISGFCLPWGELGVVTHADTWEETGDSEVQRHPSPHSEFKTSLGNMRSCHHIKNHGTKWSSYLCIFQFIASFNSSKGLSPIVPFQMPLSHPLSPNKSIAQTRTCLKHRMSFSTLQYLSLSVL